jgi:ribonuclease HII
MPYGPALKRQIFKNDMLKKFFSSTLIEAGCDEAGRGCLAGPVFAAAVILPKDFENNLLNDSKKLTEKERDFLRPIIEKEAIDWAVASVDNFEIDKINILNASFLAMHRAISKLKVKPESLLIDGNRFNKYKKIPHHCIVKGDEKYLSIAAASILAKTYRDAYMHTLHLEFPVYGWKNNKAYCTREHRSAIEVNGITPYHRMSFCLLPSQLEISFD